MSIVTKGGDQGMTSLMYGRRVSKCDPRVEAYGTVDELNAALGLAKSHLSNPEIASAIAGVQSQLIPIMGELATSPADKERYNLEGYSGFKPEFISTIETLIHELEKSGQSFRGWATPGGSPAGAALDLARTVCRRSERAVCHLFENGDKSISDVLIYLNRLSDLLWLLARRMETSG